MRSDAVVRRAPPFVVEPARKVPVLRDVDVAVVGAGCAGVCAAVAAAREGARTLLIERTGILMMAVGTGGVSGFFNCFREPLDIPEPDVERAAGRKAAEPAQLRQILGGPPWEFLLHVMKLGGMRARTEWEILRSWRILCDPEVLNYAAITFCRDNGVDVLVHHHVAGPILRGRRVTGLWVESVSGRRAVLARQVIDCSGDAHVAHGAGVPTVLGRDVGGQTASLLPTMVHYPGEVKDVPFRSGQDGANGPDPAVFRRLAEKHGFDWRRRVDNRGSLRYELAGHGVLISGLDFGDGEDLSLAEIESRIYLHEAVRFWKARVPGFKKAHLMHVSPQVLPRGGRCIVGEHFLTKEDVAGPTRFEDVIYLHRAVRHKPPVRHVDIPYGIMLPREVDNLLVAGRCASGASSARSNGSCMAMGAAAGIAAALAARSEVTPRTVPIGSLQRLLRARGVLLDKRPRVVRRPKGGRS